jgi:hypothetical protein
MNEVRSAIYAEKTVEASLKRPHLNKSLPPDELSRKKSPDKDVGELLTWVKLSSPLLSLPAFFYYLIAEFKCYLTVSVGFKYAVNFTIAAIQLIA